MKLMTFEKYGTSELYEHSGSFKPKKPGPDITKKEKSIAARVEKLIGRMNNLSFGVLKDEFMGILKDPTTHASKDTRDKWVDTANQANNKNRLMTAITNLYLKAGNLGVE